jgi:hypothetical protein
MYKKVYIGVNLYYNEHMFLLHLVNKGVSFRQMIKAPEHNS